MCVHRHTSRLSLTAALVLLTAACQAPAAEPFLKVTGKDIRDDYGKGDVVYLRGVNLGGWLLFEPWMSPMDASGLKDDYSARETLARRFGPETRDRLIVAYQDAYLTEADLDNIAALGMNVVRLPFWYLNLQDEEGTWRPDAFARLDWLVEKAWARGIYTVLDFHGVPGGQSEKDNTGRVRKKGDEGAGPEFWSNRSHVQRTGDIWRKVAAHYKGNPAVAAYDLINEPTSAPSRDILWAVYDYLYKVIRTADPDHIITVEGCWGGQVDGRYQGWGWDQLPPPSKFGWANVLYQQHNYEFSDWNSLPKQKACTDRSIADFKAHRAWRVPGFIGEFNCMGQAWSYTIEQFQAAGLSWAVWNYKATHGGGTDSWGVYNMNDPAPPKPDLRNDTAETIRERWSQWNTANAFSINPNHRRDLAMPLPVDDSYSTPTSTVLKADDPGLLANDRHVNRSSVSLTVRKVSGPSHGRLQLNPDGTFLYAPRNNYTGTDTFRYRVYDGRLESARIGTVTISVGR